MSTPMYITFSFYYFFEFQIFKWFGMWCVGLCGEGSPALF
jgi:hypothetical protein